MLDIEEANKVGDNDGIIAKKDDCILRLATEKDFDAVMQIITGYSKGFDYLPGKYHSFLKQPNRYMFVTEKCGKIVVFSTNQIVDGGRSLMGQAARSHPDIRGHDISMNFHFYEAINAITTAHPSIQYLTGSSETPSFSISRNKRGLGYEFFTMRRPKIRIWLEATDKDMLTSKASIGAGVKELSRDEAMAALENTDNLIKLFPHKKIHIAWEPYTIMKSNYEYLPMKEQFGIPTKSADGTQYGSLSFGTPFESPLGLFYILDFYGNEPESAVCHAFKHMSSALWKYYQIGKIYFLIEVPATLNYQGFVDGLRGIVPDLNIEKQEKVAACCGSLMDIRNGPAKVPSRM